MLACRGRWLLSISCILLTQFGATAFPGQKNQPWSWCGRLGRCQGTRGPSVPLSAGTESRFLSEAAVLWI